MDALRGGKGLGRGFGGRALFDKTRARTVVGLAASGVCLAAGAEWKRSQSLGRLAAGLRKISPGILNRLQPRLLCLPNGEPGQRTPLVKTCRKDIRPSESKSDGPGRPGP